MCRASSINDNSKRYTKNLEILVVPYSLLGYCKRENLDIAHDIPLHLDIWQFSYTVHAYGRCIWNMSTARQNLFALYSPINIINEHRFARTWIHYIAQWNGYSVSSFTVRRLTPNHFGTTHKPMTVLFAGMAKIFGSVCRWVVRCTLKWTTIYVYGLCE